MRKFLLVLVPLVLFVGHLAYASDNQATKKPTHEVRSAPIVEGFQLDAWFSKDHAAQFQPVDLIVTLKNTKADELGYGATSVPEHDFTFIVTDSTGRPVSPTRFGQKVESLFQGGIYSSPGGLLRGHQKAVYTFVLNGLYDLTVPDTYSVTVEYKVPTHDHKQVKTVKSLPISVTITPASPEYVQPKYTSQLDYPPPLAVY